MEFFKCKTRLVVLYALSLAAGNAGAERQPDPSTGTAFRAHAESRNEQATPAACRAGNLAAGRSRHAIESQGVEREYVLYLPHAYPAGTPSPLVLDLHGSGSNPAQELQISGLAAAAGRRGYVLVLPVAVKPFPRGGQTWNVPKDPDFPDDVQFVNDLIDEVAASVCIDRSRVYITGFSGGARLASVAACRLSGQIAALAAVGGLRPPRNCARPVPVLGFHGTADPINPYDGGGPEYWQYGVEQAFSAWGVQNHCSPGTRRERVGPDVERWSLAGCTGDSELTLYRLDGAGHVWPGSKLQLPQERFGPASATIDATQIMLDFFGSHRLPDN